MPNSSPTTSADLPLWSQFWTASRLKVSSNFRRSGTEVCFIGLVVHCSPYSLSVNSKQPQRVRWWTKGNFLQKCLAEQRRPPLPTPLLQRRRGRRTGIWVDQKRPFPCQTLSLGPRRSNRDPAGRWRGE